LKFCAYPKDFEQAKQRFGLTVVTPQMALKLLENNP
jgi:hypothetical protein